jgi:hypothetical protein
VGAVDMQLGDMAAMIGRPRRFNFGSMAAR